LFHSGNEIDLNSFPLQLIILLAASFVCIFIGSVNSYCIFEEIHISKQPGNKQLKHIIHRRVAPLVAKGGMINYFKD
jgi:hypothetical protein